MNLIDLAERAVLPDWLIRFAHPGSLAGRVRRPAIRFVAVVQSNAGTGGCCQATPALADVLDGLFRALGLSGRRRMVRVPLPLFQASGQRSPLVKRTRAAEKGKTR